jgi:hypothetical protein
LPGSDTSTALYALIFVSLSHIVSSSLSRREDIDASFSAMKILHAGIRVL